MKLMSRQVRRRSSCGRAREKNERRRKVMIGSWLFVLMDRRIVQRWSNGIQLGGRFRWWSRLKLASNCFCSVIDDERTIVDAAREVKSGDCWCCHEKAEVVGRHG